MGIFKDPLHTQHVNVSFPECLEEVGKYGLTGLVTGYIKNYVLDLGGLKFYGMPE